MLGDDEIKRAGGNITSPKNILEILLRRLWVIVLVAAVLTGSAVGFSLYQTPTYEASVKILVGQREGATVTNLAGNVEGLQQLALTMAEAVTTLPVAQAVVEQLGWPEENARKLLQNLSAEQIPNTMFIDVSYKDPDPERAQLVANTIGQVFSQKLSEVSPQANGVTATLWERAALPETPVSPNPVLNGIVALVLGIFLGVGLAFLLEHLGDNRGSPEEMEQVSGVPTFGAIPKFDVSARKKGKQYVSRFRLQNQVLREDEPTSHSEHLVTALDPGAKASEAYRTLRASLLYAVVDAPPKVILITSPGSAEGKSITCANLGVVLAQAGKETLVIDGDLRESIAHKIFGIDNTVGVVNLVAGQYNLSKVWKEPLPGLKVVPVGPPPPNPTELLGSDRFAQFIAQTRRMFDYVLIDSPPTQLVSDPIIIATQADAVLLVLESQRTSKGSLRGAVRSLEAVGANVLGTVMNKVETTENGRYGYGYYTKR